METVSGIGGVFFRSAAPGDLADWYEANLGVRKTPESYEESPGPNNGRFAHLDDPEGNRIELWEPAGQDLTPRAEA